MDGTPRRQQQLKLRALRLLVVDGARFAPGCTFKVDEKTARELVLHGDAEIAPKHPLPGDPSPLTGRLLHR